MPELEKKKKWIIFRDCITGLRRWVRFEEISVIRETPIRLGSGVQMYNEIWSNNVLVGNVNEIELEKLERLMDEE